MKINSMCFLIIAILGILLTVVANPVNTYAKNKNLETSDLTSDKVKNNESGNKTSTSSEDSSQISQAKFADKKTIDSIFKNSENTLLTSKALKIIPSDYKVTVSFESVKVHNTHEGAFSGDGEYDLAVYVQGQKVVLTDPNAPGQGLWDVSDEETVTFSPSKEITVSVSKNIPLSIFTVGSEVDGCDRTAFPENIQSNVVSALSKGVNYLVNIGDIQDELNSAINWVGCKLNPNDEIGKINKIYEPVNFGQGEHTENSSSGDFTMKYTITVIPPKNILKDLGTANQVLSVK